MDYKAIHRFADTGPRKIRQFADLIRGRNVDEALQLLRFHHNKGAKLIQAVVQSALGNATHLECPDVDSLVVSEARVDGAPFFKRMQPRARGTAFMLKCRFSHIHVTLSDPAEPEPKAAPAITTTDAPTPDASLPPAPPVAN